jgi:predicted phage replisome organizer
VINLEEKEKKKKYYWLRLKKDFFKRHDIQIIEAMDNGKDYILFYLKMLVESVDHEGNLRFNDTIPYDEKMLATITNTNIDIVRSAMKVFTGLNMMEVLEDKTIYMSEVEKMLGSETYWAEQKRKQREKEKNAIGHCPNNVLIESNVSNQEKEIEKELDIDINNNTSSKDEINILIEEIWKIYPNKKGKADVIKKIPKILKTISKDKLIESIERYKKDVDYQRKNGFKNLNYMNGSTFFNGRYMDYLEEKKEEVTYNKIYEDFEFND